MRCTLVLALALASSAIGEVATTRAAEISRWRFDGDATDSIGGRHGTLVGDATFSSDVPPDRSGLSLSLDGMLDKMVFDVAGADVVAGEFTVAAWVKLAAARPQGTLAWFGTRYPDDNGFDFKARGSESTSIRVDLGDGSSIPVIHDGPPLLTVDSWRHVAVTVTNDRMGLYIDGAFVHETAFASFSPLLWDENHDIAIGAISADLLANGPPTGEDFAGLIDDVRVFNTALTAKEVARLVIPEPSGVILAAIGVLSSAAICRRFRLRKHRTQSVS